MALKALVFTQGLSRDTSEDPHQHNSLRTPGQDRAGTSKHPTKRVEARSHLQAATLPPDLQDPTINNAVAISLPKQLAATLFLKKGKPITQEQGYLDLLLTPSVILKAPLFNSCS